ncbi:MAG: tRNA (N6-threonylcarbamoyladenosine(37)-N6)-methyltransferase TrmO [Chloroflexota bacterium]
MGSMTEADLEAIVRFHGHLCPGLATGMRVAQVALRELGPRAADEELVAVVESDNCAVDAIQFLVGATFGKGNLIHLDHGQNVFTFARRSDGRAVRVSARPHAGRRPSLEQQALVERARAQPEDAQTQAAMAALWRQRALDVLAMDEAELLDVERLDRFPIPDRASVHPSVRCDRCGRLTMATRIERVGERNLCRACLAMEADERVLSLRPIGVVRNELHAGQAPSLAQSESSRIEVYPKYAAGLEGIASCEQLDLLFWFDRAAGDAPLVQHPRGDANRLARGVFSLRSPSRPNPIGLSVVQLLGVEGNAVHVAGLDAWDGTPVLDIKPHGM